MDQIIIKDLEIFGFHGVNPEEKAMGQKFILDARVDLDLSDACTTDDLKYTINYAQLCHEMQAEFQSQKHDLIEHAVHLLAQFVLVKYPQVQKVDLTLKKPWAPIHLPIKYPAVRIVRERHIAYIAVGANMGDKHENIETAMAEIDKSAHTKILTKSSLIETDPVGYEDQDQFLNGVFKVSTTLSPKQLVKWLLSIEAMLKRERVIRWGPRTIDLDVIYYDDLVSDDMEVTLPHPRMHERAFVLEPLNEIAPYAVHPIFRKRTVDLLKELNEA